MLEVWRPFHEAFRVVYRFHVELAARPVMFELVVIERRALEQVLEERTYRERDVPLVPWIVPLFETEPVFRVPVIGHPDAHQVTGFEDALALAQDRDDIVFFDMLEHIFCENPIDAPIG